MQQKNNFVTAIMQLCSIFSLPSEDKLDARPHMAGQLEDTDTTFLIDTGAAISCIS